MQYLTHDDQGLVLAGSCPDGDAMQTFDWPSRVPGVALPPSDVCQSIIVHESSVLVKHPPFCIEDALRRFW